MKFTIYRADCCGNAANCVYPVKVAVSDAETLKRVVAHDHVCCAYKDNYRSNDNFDKSDTVVMDLDNDHSDVPADWVSAKNLIAMLPDVSYALVPSRNNMVSKNGKAPRPKYHVCFPIQSVMDRDAYTTLKRSIEKAFPFFDGNALDAARFIFGSVNGNVIWHEGNRTIGDFLDERAFAEYDKASESIGEGSRNNTMSRFAGRIIKRLGNTEEAHRQFLKKAAKCSPPLEDAELSAIWASAVKFGEKVSRQKGYIPPDEYNKPLDWEEPIPFDECHLPAFPVDALPAPIANHVLALAESTQTPVDMAATSALAVLSVCMQGKYKIRGKPDWTEPVNLFVLAVMRPSERKSAVANAMTRPLNVFETEYNKRIAADIEYSKMRKRILERKQKALEDQAAKGKASAEDIQDIAEQIAEYKELKPLKLYVDDITTEKLASVLAQNNGRAAILSTEGGIFDTLSGTYSKNVNIDVMLKGYSGDSIRVDRIGRSSESILNPALTVLLMVQPSVLSGLMQNGTFRGRGLTARFLYSIPDSFVGERKFLTASVPEEVYQAYENRICNILEDECEGEVITLSAEATRMLQSFAEDLEPKLKNEYEDIADWAGKLVGNILRISALLCRASIHIDHDFLDKPEPLVVDGDTMKRAIRIGNYFTEHAVAAFLLMGIDLLTQRSRKVLDAIKKNGLVEFTRRDIMRLCRTIKTADATQEILDQLVDYGYISEKPQETYSGTGRPKGATYLVNPKLYM